MKPPLHLPVVGLLILSASAMSALAQLPSRSDLLVEKYEEDRARGIAALNKRYIAILKKELDIAIVAKELKEANWIQSKIQMLQAEINDSADSANTASIEDKTKDPDFLVGKLIEYPHNNDPTQKAYLAFYEDGKAAYLGSKNQSVPREYKPTGKTREFIVTWPGRQDDHNTYLITLSPDGKSATLVLRYNNKTSPGIIQDGD